MGLSNTTYEVIHDPSFEVESEAENYSPSESERRVDILDRAFFNRERTPGKLQDSRGGKVVAQSAAQPTQSTLPSARARPAGMLGQGRAAGFQNA